MEEPMDNRSSKFLKSPKIPQGIDTHISYWLDLWNFEKDIHLHIMNFEDLPPCYHCIELH